MNSTSTLNNTPNTLRDMNILKDTEENTERLYHYESINECGCADDYEYADGYIDLHTHSTASDGSMTPAELVRHAINSGLKAIALTDHDTIDGIESVLDEGMKNNFLVIPGVEISADYKKELHILGYFSKKNYKRIGNILDVLKKSRELRNEKTVKKLNEIGINITMEEVKERADGGLIGRPHIARTIVEKGYANTIGEAFNEYLAFGKVAYFKKEKLTPQQGICEILKAGGVPVLAHPVLLYMSKQELDDFLRELCSYGLKGIEAFYVDNTEEDTKTFLALAEKHNLIVTGGSDFHGSFKPDIKIGKGYGDLKVPYRILENLEKLILQAEY